MITDLPDVPVAMPSIERKEVDEEVLSAVFEVEEVGGSRYFIYKLDYSSASASAVSATAASGDADALPDFGQPILSLDPSNPNIPADVKIARRMIVFSKGSRIYFVGGCHRGYQYQKEAFFLDLSSTSTSASGTTTINPPVAIQPMNSPKQFPWIFGPIGDQFYIISASQSSDCSFESLNLRTNTWDSLPLPDSDPAIKSFLSVRYQQMLNIKATAVCDSNICIATVGGPLFVYFTKTNTWQLINWSVPNKYGYLSIPFYGAAVPLIVGNEHLFLRLISSLNGVFRLYSCPYSPVDESLMNIDFHSYPGFLRPIAGLFGLTDYLKKWGEYELDEKPDILFWSFDNKPGRICIFYHGYPDSLIHICDLSLMEGYKVRAKVVNAVTYKHSSDKYMEPRLFLFVKGTSSTPSE